MKVRKATEKDLEFVFDCVLDNISYHQRLDDSFPSISIKEKKILLNRYIKMLDNVAYSIYIAKVNNEYAGIIVFEYKNGHVKIQDLFVLPEFRGNDIGKKLVDMIQSSIVKVKVFNENKNAYKFYTKLDKNIEIELVSFK